MTDDRSIFSRRTLLTGTAAGAVALGLRAPALAALLPPDPWDQARAIAQRLEGLRDQPWFRGRDARQFHVTAYGAAPCQIVAIPFLYLSASTSGAGSAPATGSFDNHAAFAAAISACHHAGGGRVVVPAGNWYCAGPVTLLSNVNFHLAKGAQIWFSPNPADYAKYGPYDFGANGNLVQSRWQGNDCYNFSSMIYAKDQENIALTGEDWTSILNGQAGTLYNTTNCWWTWKGTAGADGFVAGQPSEGTANALNLPIGPLNPALSTAEVNLIEFGSASGGTGNSYTKDSSYLPALSEANIPLDVRIFGVGHQLPPCMIELFNCRNVWLEGYQVTNTPFWQHHPIACTDLVIRKVYANSIGPNNDGFDPEACDHVLVDEVTFNTGDDCIAIKSGKDNDIEYGPAQNHLIRNCTMNSGHGGITLGSEMSAGVKNVYAENLSMENQNYATNPLNIAIRVKTNLNRGGTVEEFHVRNVTLPNGINLTPSFYKPLTGSPIPVNTVSTNQGGVITFDCDYSPGSDNVRIRPPTVKNITISNVTVTAPPGASASCYQAIIVQGPVASDYNGLTAAPTVVPVEDVTITNCNFGTPANTAAPIYLYNIQGLTLSKVTIGTTVYNEVLSA
jgi:polygalacturonase